MPWQPTFSLYVTYMSGMLWEDVGDENEHQQATSWYQLFWVATGNKVKTDSNRREEQKEEDPDGKQKESFDLESFWMCRFEKYKPCCDRLKMEWNCLQMEQGDP